MHRETGYKKLQKTYIPTDIYQRYLLVMLGKKQTQNEREHEGGSDVPPCITKNI